MTVNPERERETSSDTLLEPDRDASPDGGASALLAESVVPAETVDPASPPAPARPVAFVDSSALVALADRDDASHVAALAAYRELVAAGYKLFTTNYAVAETFDLLQTGLGVAAARRWLRDARLAVYHADAQDEARARRLVLRANERRPLTLSDAVGLAVMDRLGVHDAFAVDQHFLAETS